jgi:protease-4
MWWTFGMLALVTIIIMSCSLPFILSSDRSGSVISGTGDAVAVIHLDGVIAGTGATGSGYVTPESFLDQLDKAADDDRVKAVVLRVDSPGGTVAASEEIAAYVRGFKKPIVVSIGDIGASGAYMVSSQADEIIANPGSSVGSIGVISEIPNVAALLGKIGVEFQVITAGKNKDTGSPYRSLTKEERALIQGEVNEAYEQFIGIVAEGRKMKPEKVRELATGWTWSGDKALELGLIDKIGTYQDALASAAKRGGIKGSDYEVITYKDELEQVLGSLLGIRGSLAQLADPTASKEDAARQAVPR